jgi:hypothetical protein
MSPPFQVMTRLDRGGPYSTDEPVASNEHIRVKRVTPLSQATTLGTRMRLSSSQAQGARNFQATGNTKKDRVKPPSTTMPALPNGETPSLPTEPAQNQQKERHKTKPRLSSVFIWTKRKLIIVSYIWLSGRGTSDGNVVNYSSSDR